MKLIENILLLKKNIATNYAVYKIIKFMKKSDINAFVIGNEIIYIYSLIYNKYKDNDGNYDIDNEFYNYLINIKNYNQMYLYDFITKNILFSKFFTKLNLKIFKMKSNIYWSYLRGYYVNDFEFFIFHINKCNTSYCIIYDYHPHYITFIYEFFKKIYVNNIDMNIELNNDYDIYSLDNETKNTNYKLIINHAPHDFNNPILDLFKFLYINVNHIDELHDTLDIKLYQQFQYYEYYL